MKLWILPVLAGVVCYAADSRDFPPEAIEAGGAQFADACAACHGSNGEGGRGPSLVDGREVRRATDEQLFSSISKGVPGADMPPFPFPDEQVWNLVAFVRSLSAPAVEMVVEGDAAAGEALFFGSAGCWGCHRVRGQGGRLGPDLTNVGATRRLDQIRESLLEPNARIADGFRAATLETSGGESVRAVVKNHSNFSAQVLDANGRLHLLRSAELGRLRFETKSWMPDDWADRLSDGQIRDVVAYLSRQAVRPPEGR